MYKYNFCPLIRRPHFQIITETVEARKALEDVQIRHQELIKLEQSIIGLRDLFLEMALLVEQQVR